MRAFMRFDVPVPLSTAPRLWPTRANNDALGNRTEAAKVPAAPAQGAHSGCERLRLGAFLEGNKFLHASNSRGTCNTVAWKHPPLLHVASCLYLLAHPVLSSCFMHFFSSFFFPPCCRNFLPACSPGGHDATALGVLSQPRKARADAPCGQRQRRSSGH